MAEPGCGVPEERWVDWHLKRLSGDAREALERHLAACADCRRAHDHWGQLLGTSWEENSAGTGEMPADAKPIDMRVRPGARVRRKLRAWVIRRYWRERWARKPYMLAAAGMFVFILLAAVWLGQDWLTGKSNDRHPAALPPMEYARLHEPYGVYLMQQPDTLVFQASPVVAPGFLDSPNRSTVIVWANPRTEEIFVLMDGMLPAESRDIQVWGSSGSGRQMTNLGLLKFHQWQGHLYSHIYSLWELEELTFTIEPKGGSQQPTAPETAKLRLFARP